MAVARVLRPTNNFSKIPVAARNRIIFWTRKYAREIQRHIQGEMRKPKHGRIYKINGRLHQASAPGEYPAILSGALYKDLNPRYTSGGMRASIAPRVTSKTGAPYPDFLERGTRKMEPRPFMKPGFDRYREIYKSKIRQIFSELTT